MRHLAGPSCVDSAGHKQPEASISEDTSLRTRGGRRKTTSQGPSPCPSSSAAGIGNQSCVARRGRVSDVHYRQTATEDYLQGRPPPPPQPRHRTQGQGQAGTPDIARDPPQGLSPASSRCGAALSSLLFLWGQEGVLLCFLPETSARATGLRCGVLVLREGITLSWKPHLRVGED